MEQKNTKQQMSLEEYKKQLEEVVNKATRHQQYLRETLQETKDNVWQMYLEDNLDPSTALYMEAQGL